MRIRLLILPLLFAALIAAEALLYQPMFPFTPGNSNDFWTAATFNDFSRTGALHNVAKTDGDYFYYASVGYHGPIYRRVPRADALRDFPRILATLRTLPAATDPSDYGQALQDVTGALRRWDALPPADQTPETLIDLLRSQRQAAITPLEPKHARYFHEAHTALSEAIAKSHRYPLTCLFETAFLASLLLLIAFPLLRPPSAARILLAWPLAVLLFFLPSWLGYASMTLRPWGPSGGILYPHLLWYAGRTDLFPLEIALLDTLPKPLQALSQDDVIPLLSFPGGVLAAGPHLAFYYLLGALIAAAGTHQVRRHFAERKRTRPGFPILSPSPAPD